MAEQDEARLEIEHEFLDSAKSFNWDKVKTMLTRTPDLINVQPCGRWTALHQAAFEGNSAMCGELLGLGADPNATNHSGRTALEVAKGKAKDTLETAKREGGAKEEAEEPVKPPPMKKAKKATVYNMNINHAVDKEYEGCSFGEIATAPVSALEGVAVRGQEILTKFHVKTIKQLARWKFYRMAKGIVGLSELEEKGVREEYSRLNIDKALDKKHESKSLQDITKLPPSALQGLAGWADEELAKLHIKTIADLANWKFARWSEWITDLAEFEE